MKRAFDDPLWARQVAEAGCQAYNVLFSPEKAGADFVARIYRLLRTAPTG